MSTVRTRFAPSPTGYLHIGGARTALFNFLFARHHGGVFVLRIEDTDRERSTAESIEAILDSLRWLGLDWDEGPFYQSERGELYREHAERLLAAGHAYRCYCTPEELEQHAPARPGSGRKPIYDRRCRERRDRRRPTRPFTIRFKAPLIGETVVDDASYAASVVFQNSEIDDLIIVRSDGSPTYNFCVVVDDALMAHHPHHPRRGSSAEHAEADADLPGARLHAAALRARAAHPRSRSRPAQQAPRRHLGARRTATPAICPRRSTTTWSASAGRTATRRSSPAPS